MIPPSQYATAPGFISVGEDPRFYFIRSRFPKKASLYHSVLSIGKEIDMYIPGKSGFLVADLDHLSLRVFKNGELSPVRKFADYIGRCRRAVTQ